MKNHGVVKVKRVIPQRSINLLYKYHKNMPFRFRFDLFTSRSIGLWVERSGGPEYSQSGQQLLTYLLLDQRRTVFNIAVLNPDLL